MVSNPRSFPSTVRLLFLFNHDFEHFFLHHNGIGKITHNTALLKIYISSKGRHLEIRVKLVDICVYTQELCVNKYFISKMLIRLLENVFKKKKNWCSNNKNYVFRVFKSLFLIIIKQFLKFEIYPESNTVIYFYFGSTLMVSKYSKLLKRDLRRKRLLFL